MRRLVLFIMCAALALSGCSSGSSSGGGQSATGKADGAENENADHSDKSEKPELEILGEEREDFYRAVDTRAQKTTSDPNAYKLKSLGDSGDQAATAQGQSQTAKDYTMMVYIIGSNLESRLGAATYDIEEMRDAGLDYDKTNLLVYTGGSRRWVSDIPNNTNNVLDLSEDAETQITAQTSKSANMGDFQTLAEFINYSTQNYPAEHYGLILWDHGGGPLWGYGSDELFGNDCLVFKELREALDNTDFGPENKLDFVGFDACLMGSVENANLWKDYAHYLVSSEEVEAGKGWDYHFLSVLNESQAPEDVVKSIINSFGSFYENSKNSFYNPDATLSAMDLSQTENLVEAISSLFSVMDQDIKEGNYAQINRARCKAKAFGLKAVGNIDESYDLIDLKDFAEQTKSLFPEESRSVVEAVDKIVIASTSNVDGAGGVSIYFPGNNKSLYDASEQMDRDNVAISSDYRSFVKSYTDEWYSESEIMWNLPGLENDNGELVIHLNSDQARNVSQAYYSILRRVEEEYYSPVMMNIPIDADENGVLRIPADPMVATVVSDEYESSLPWSCRQIERKGDVNLYGTYNTYISAACGIVDFDPNTDEAVEIQFKSNEGETATELQDVHSNTEGVWSSGKESINLLDYTGVIDLGAFAYKPKRFSDGEIAPHWYWWDEGDFILHTDPVPVDSSFHFEMQPISLFDDTFACQVIIRDINDNIHASECMDFQKSDSREIVMEETENGILQFELFEDHAEVTSYEGTDETVEIPASVSGKEVTVVQKSAFNNGFSMDDVQLPVNLILPDTITEIDDEAMPGMESVVLPEGLKRIGKSAFNNYMSKVITIPDSVEYIGNGAFLGSKLEEVTLPASLKRIGALAFGNCPDLREISISEDNTYYKSVDGVLYSGDGKTLIQYPLSKGGSYEIPEGTETIAYAAFAGSKIEDIVFPKTLQKIENAAFSDCEYIKGLEFPDSLKEIGSLAFGTFYSSDLFREIDRIHLGANIRRIGSNAFTTLENKEFDVDPLNKNYASENGFLVNKAKDTILTAPLGMGDSVIIPDGITTLQSGVFNDVKAKEYYIPDSVYRFAEDVFGMSNVETSSIQIHCTEGSAAEAYAEKYGIPYDHDINIIAKEETKTGSEDSSGTNTKEVLSGEYVEEVQEESRVIEKWRLFSDHAQLVSVESDDNIIEFEIPAEYKGQPVTVLGLKEDEISDGYWNVVKLSIPETVQTIYPSFWHSTLGLESINVAEGNSSYRSENGVLFSSDHVLVYYPSERTDAEYAIPEGTTEVGEYACNATYLEKVILPESLTSIGDGAFSDCWSLTKVEFNEGLVKIGNSAFGVAPLQGVELPSSVEEIDSFAFGVGEGFGEIVLPESITYLGSHALSANEYEGVTVYQDSLRIPNKLRYKADAMDGILIKEFRVDEDHPYHSVVDGILMSKDKKTLVCAPGQREGEMVVPDGVQTIEYGAFDNCSNLTDVYLPDSVEDVGNLGEDGYDGTPCPYIVHCHEGTTAQKALEDDGVSWVKIEN